MANGYDVEEAEYFVDKTVNGPNGLPAKWSEVEMLGEEGEKTHIMCIVEKVIFFPAAYGIYALYLNFGATTAVAGDGVKGANVPMVTAKIALLSAYCLGYLYLAGLVLSILKTVTGQLSVKYRTRAPANSPDQHIYQVVNNGPYVLMAANGPQGEFNRAQRAKANYDEYECKFVLLCVLAGFVFPECVLAIVVLVAIARIYQLGSYAEDPEGRGNVYMIHVHMMVPLLEGLVAVAGVLTFL